MIVTTHYIYISLQEIFLNTDSDFENKIVDREKENAERESILRHMREEEKEESELISYVKDKIKVLKSE